MKPLYLLTFSLLLFTSCSKDFLKKYDKRIIGTWTLTDVDSRGIGGTVSNLPFQDGTFVFGDEGSLTYTNGAGVAYTGNWDINKNPAAGDGGAIHELSINVVDYATQELRSELFENMDFTRTNRFKAYIYSGAHTYVFHFSRN